MEQHCCPISEAKALPLRQSFPIKYCMQCIKGQQDTKAYIHCALDRMEEPTKDKSEEK